jgi:hypothetical protein
MHKSNASTKHHGPTWATVIEDAEAEICQARQRIERLQGVIRVCQRLKDAGQPFPASKESDCESVV